MDASERRWLRVDEFREEQPHVGRRTLYDWAKEGRILSVMVGRRLLIASDALDILAQRQIRESAQTEEVQ